jgi:comEA protein
MKRHWFFLTEKLQITPAERKAVTTLIAVLVVLWTIPASWFRPEPFDQDYYAPILAEFQEKVQLREIEREQTLARFYPPVKAAPQAEPNGHTGPNRSIADVSGVRPVPPTTLMVPSSSPPPPPSSPTLPPTSTSNSTSPNQPGTNAAGETLSIPAGLQDPVRSAGSSSAATANVADGSGLPVSGSVSARVSARARLSGVAAADTVNAQGRAQAEPGSGGRININTADVTELQKLPGIGPSIAARIVEYRAENGPFRAVDEITGVRGIGVARLNSLRNSITVD